MKKDGKVLIVDDEPSAIKVLSAILKEDWHNVLEAADVESAIETIKSEDVDAIITDLKMPGKDGLQFFEYVNEFHPDIPVIFLTAYGTVESAVNAMTNGAFYYFIKPPDYIKLKSILARAIEQHHLRKELENLRNRVSIEHNSFKITGNSSQLNSIFNTIDSIKDSESNVLICGETGTGKELIAKKIHYSSKRNFKPFIVFNCAAIPSELLESELFGYEKGAFTGAISRRIGKFEEASEGTIFLDEIGELGLPLQAKLLRILQEREIERLGNNKKIKVNFRLITSTNRNLNEEVKVGNFRQDLFYRINVVKIDVPPLRHRMEDIPLLVSEFLNEFCAREKKILTLSDGVMEAFMNYSWPGNVRQLKNSIERAVVLAKGNSITIDDLSNEFTDLIKRIDISSPVLSLKDLEHQAIIKALEAFNGNKSKAAHHLGISRKALYKRIRDYNLFY